jgi:hypothetical protein
MMVRARARLICWRVPVKGHRDGDDRDRDFGVGYFPAPLGDFRKRALPRSDQFANTWAARGGCTIMGPKYRAAWAFIGNG